MATHGPTFTAIRELVPGMKNINLYVIVLDIGNAIITKEGREVRTIRVADRTGSVNTSVWDEYGRLIQSGDIITMLKVYTSVWKSCLTVYVGKFGEIVKIGEFCMLFSELPDFSAVKPEYKDYQPTNLRDKDDSRLRKADGDQKPGFHGGKKDDGAQKRVKPAPSATAPQGGANPKADAPNPPRPTTPSDPRTQRWASRDPRSRVPRS